jgi:hypothetical protein
MYHEYLYPNMIVFSTLSARSGAEVNIIRRIMADRERETALCLAMLLDGEITTVSLTTWRAIENAVAEWF